MYPTIIGLMFVAKRSVIYSYPCSFHLVSWC